MSVPLDDQHPIMREFYLQNIERQERHPPGAECVLRRELEAYGITAEGQIGAIEEVLVRYMQASLVSGTIAPSLFAAFLFGVRLARKGLVPAQPSPDPRSFCSSCGSPAGYVCMLHRAAPK